VTEGQIPGAAPAAEVRDIADRRNAAVLGQSLRGELNFLALLALLALLSAVFRVEFGPYYPIHMGMEFLSLVLVVLVFAVVWQTPAVEVSGSYLVLAIALLASGWFAFANAFSFRGLPEPGHGFATDSADLMLLLGRLVVALSLLGVSFYPALKPATSRVRYGIFAGYTLLCVLASSAVFFYDAALPGLHPQGIQATHLSTAVTWFCLGLLTLAGWRWYHTAKRSSDKVTATLFLAVATVGLGELMVSHHDTGNAGHDLLGHAYRLLAYGLFYRAMFSACVNRAYDILTAQKLQRRQTDQTLRTQVLALNATVTPIFMANLTGALLWHNRASRALMGQSSSSSKTSTSLFTAPVTPDPAQAQEMRATLEAGEVWQGQVRTQSPQGHEIVLDRTVTPVRDKRGELHGYVAVSENVTEREYAELRYKRVLDMSIDGFFIADAQGQLLEVNDAYARLTGYTAAELRTMHVSQLEGSRHSTAVQQRIENVVRLGKDHFEARFRSKTCQEFVVDVTVMYDPEYRLLFGFVRDRTEMVQAESARKALERQLQQSQKVEQLGQLTGGIAHDFNNSLATILGYSRLALDRFVPDRQGELAHYLDEVVAASERARDLIAKMLTFAGNRPSVDIEVVKASTVVNQVVAMMRVSIPAGIEVKTWIEDDLAIHIDPGELSQILVNLVINARDAIGEHGTIDLLAHRTTVNNEMCAASQVLVSGTFVAVEVRDNGQGIAKEHISRLFDPFFTTKDVGKGTGLGLSMVQGILRRSNAYAIVKSTPGRGSSFKLLFPIVSAHVSATPEPETRAVLPLVSGRRIWVLDDEPAVARYLSELLESWGYQVRLFNHPKLLLTAFETESSEADLVITDQTMPGMTGLFLAQRLLAIKPGLPIILCSGYTDARNFTEAQREGVRRCLMKPINPKELREALAENILA
jgi:PAS domain S-box-containing protein